jgi:hypothetical protein
MCNSKVVSPRKDRLRRTTISTYAHTKTKVKEREREKEKIVRFVGLVLAVSARFCFLLISPPAVHDDEDE